MNINRKFRCNHGSAEKRAVGEFVKKFMRKVKGDVFLYGTPTPISRCKETGLLNDSCLVMARLLSYHTENFRIFIGSNVDVFKANDKAKDFEEFGFDRITVTDVSPNEFKLLLKKIKRETTIVFMMSGQYIDYRPIWDRFNKGKTNVLCMAKTRQHSGFEWQYWKAF